MKRIILFILTLAIFKISSYAEYNLTKIEGVNVSTFDKSSSAPTSSYKNANLVINFFDINYMSEISYQLLFQFYYNGKCVCYNSVNSENIQYNHIQNTGQTEVGFPIKDLYLYKSNGISLQAFLLYDKRNNTPIVIRIQIFVQNELRISSSLEYTPENWQILKKYFKKFESTF